MDNVRRRQGAASSSTDDAKDQTYGSSGKNNTKAKDKEGYKTRSETPTWVNALLISFALVTVVTYPVPFQPHGEPTLKHVFFYGWMTAISTGCGVLPFMILQDVAKFWVGISNGTSLHFSFCYTICDLGIVPSLSSLLLS